MKKEKIVQFHKSGSGNISTRLSIPASWLAELGITEKEKKVIIEKKEKEIRIYKGEEE
ncbi:hypothetical protein [Fusobacterium gastrosuis]|uniref:hypothetical protein n=1 Tax=Fusobacterium gastrosuis TaxID=1755100 RepID=UPI002978EF00|nr:hypothetical protein [Fusobacteriaceae bacterium]MDY5713617.1 hypothetical protein [Fusobacterium gastrosuis]